MSRVISANRRLKATEAKLEVRGSVMASDAFFHSATASTRRRSRHPRGDPAGGSMRDADDRGGGRAWNGNGVYWGRHFRH
jgi:phosphoribosylaminoimidazolecarboxamide formyltransferase/IMP cyclohydrolase